jgi:hypothetical protein
MLKNLLLNLAKDFVFDALITVLRQEAKKSETPIDDEMVDYMSKAKPELLAALNKAF